MTVILDGYADPLRFWFKYDKRHGSMRTMVFCDAFGVVNSFEERCSASDQFVKAVGRRKALMWLLATRAIVEYVSEEPSAMSPCFRLLSRAERARVWFEYFRVHSDLRRRDKAHKGAI